MEPRIERIIAAFVVCTAVFVMLSLFKVETLPIAIAVPVLFFVYMFSYTEGFRRGVQKKEGTIPWLSKEELPSFLKVGSKYKSKLEIKDDRFSLYSIEVPFPEGWRWRYVLVPNELVLPEKFTVYKHTVFGTSEGTKTEFQFNA